jgi:hypothetical protein
MFRPVLLAAVLAVFLASPQMAGASIPGASTGAATKVTATTATLNGVVNPNKEDTTFVFEYGTTTAYGTATAAQPAVSGNAGKDVSADITGLTPGTTYHFRLVATNPSGTDQGNDATFTTLAANYPLPTPPPAALNAVTIAAAPVLITFGRSTVVSGQLTGPGQAGVKVDLQTNPYPFTAGFKNAGLTATTDATGKYAFTVKPGLFTRYQVVAKASPPVTSAVVEVRVRYLIAFKANDYSARRGQLIRFSGYAKPAHDGRTVSIQRRTAKGTYRTIATTRLRKSTIAGRSTYRRSLRVSRTGVYRVRISADADHATGTSRTRRVRVAS